MPNYPPIYRQLAFALVRLGRIDEAREAMNRVLQLDPDYRISSTGFPWRDPAFGDECRAAYRLAGAPE
jgi:hypothetical protein